MSQQVGIAYELYAIAGAVLGGCSLRGGEGTIFGVVIGCAIMRVIDNGINMFQFKYHAPDGRGRIWRLDPNWNFIIIGAVILLAVILDQVAHIVEAKRRTRRIADVPAPVPAKPAPLA
jgi:ribose transport system permease protein